VAPALPRTEAHGEAFEIVEVLGPGGVRTIWLDRWTDNSRRGCQGLYLAG
jgi:hypothetical protein